MSPKLRKLYTHHKLYGLPKFIRTFLRAAYHFDDCDVVLLPYEIDECVHFKIGKSLKCNNHLLDDTIIGVESGIRKR